MTKQKLSIHWDSDIEEKYQLIAAYYEAHFDSLTTFATRKLGDQDTAQSSVQEAFSRLLRNLDKFYEKKENVLDVHQYVITCILNEIRSLFRNLNKRPHSSMEDYQEKEGGKKGWIEAYETRDLLQEIINQAELAEEDLTLLGYLRQGFKPQEIVEVMNLADKEDYRKARFRLIRRLQRASQEKGIELEY